MYYEDQKVESLRKSKDFVANRLPKFLGYFERVLQGKASGDGPWLYGGRLTYADLVLFQVGCAFPFSTSFPPLPPHSAFPRYMIYLLRIACVRYTPMGWMQVTSLSLTWVGT